MTWEAFLETALKWHEMNVVAQPSSMPTQKMEVGSSRKSVERNKAPKHDVTRMYKRGKRIFFSFHGDKEAKPST